MLLHKSLNIDNFDQIQDYFKSLQLFSDVDKNNQLVTKTFSKDEIFQCEPLADFILKNNLELDIARFLYTRAHSSVPIHVDGSSTKSRILAVNFPIEGCENTQMIWWDNVNLIENKNISPTYGDNYGSAVSLFDGKNKTIIESIELTRPTIVRIDQPHSVNNNNDYYRLILSLRFTPEPLHLWPDSII